MRANKLLLGMGAGLGIALYVLPSQASSHREAPFITQMPKVDGTDLYMFRSFEPGREGYVTLIANYIPFQDPWGGPNYYMLDNLARYKIHIDNDGDAMEDIVFEFDFKNEIKGIALDVGGESIPIPLINIGQIEADSELGDPELNVIESYKVAISRPQGNGNGNATGRADLIANAATGETQFRKPVDYIGQKSIPNYEAYANSFIHDISIPGCGDGRVFVGQRNDPFFVNLGEIFDLVNLDNPVAAEENEVDIISDQNVTSLVLEVPIDCLVDGDPVIGGWTTASVRQVRQVKLLEELLGTSEQSPAPGAPDTAPGQANEEPIFFGGRFVQVSRLGNPLVNEVVIGLPHKDIFNASEPTDDRLFLEYVQYPTVPVILQTLFDVTPPAVPRQDLVATFLTGIEGLNKPGSVVPAEMMRLNTSIPPTPVDAQNPLGVIGGDNAGFPNGRRPGDDVVDIELRVLMGKLISLGLFPGEAPAGALELTDGASQDASTFGNAFPYLNTPIPGSPNEAYFPFEPGFGEASSVGDAGDQ